MSYIEMIVSVCVGFAAAAGLARVKRLLKRLALRAGGSCPGLTDHRGSSPDLSSGICS